MESVASSADASASDSDSAFSLFSSDDAVRANLRVLLRCSSVGEESVLPEASGTGELFPDAIPESPASVLHTAAIVSLIVIPPPPEVSASSCFFRIVSHSSLTDSQHRISIVLTAFNRSWAVLFKTALSISGIKPNTV